MKPKAGEIIIDGRTYVFTRTYTAKHSEWDIYLCPGSDRRFFARSRADGENYLSSYGQGIPEVIAYIDNLEDF